MKLKKSFLQIKRFSKSVKSAYKLQFKSICIDKITLWLDLIGGLLNNNIRIGPVVRITRSHRVGRGSIPRFGTFLLVAHFLNNPHIGFCFAASLSLLAPVNVILRGGLTVEDKGRRVDCPQDSVFFITSFYISFATNPTSAPRGRHSDLSCGHAIRITRLSFSLARYNPSVP